MRTKSVFFLPIVMIMMMMTSSAENIIPDPDISFQDSREYCQSEFFNATCPGPSDVIIMESARYGRMSVGRCISDVHGTRNIGCSKDVLWFFDGQCSGRNKCRVFVANSILMQRSPCQKELFSYLQAKYYCVTVASARTASACRNGRYISLSAASGYISSEMAIAYGYGTSDCPIRIQVSTGQQIRLTRIAFTGRRTTSDDEEWEDEYPSRSKDVCYEIGLIDSGADLNRTLTACSGTGSGNGATGNGRKLHNLLYLSDGNVVTLYLSAKNILRELSPFVIRYEGHGCESLHAPAGGWVKTDRDFAEIGCNHGSQEEKWTVSCIGTRWVGHVGNCSHTVPALGASSATQSDEAFPYGILVVVAIGVAVGIFVGGILLTVVALCMRRKSKRDSLTTIEFAEDNYTRSSDAMMTSSILDGDLMRCAIHRDDRRYRINPGSTTVVNDHQTTGETTLVTTAANYEDQLYFCRPMKPNCAPTAMGTRGAQIKSLHLYETPQFG